MNLRPLTKEALAPLHADLTMTLADIAKQFGVTRSAVSIAVIRHDLPRRRRGRWREGERK